MTLATDLQARLEHDLREWFEGNGPARASDPTKLAAYLHLQGWV